MNYLQKIWKWLTAPMPTEMEIETHNRRILDGLVVDILTGFCLSQRPYFIPYDVLIKVKIRHVEFSFSNDSVYQRVFKHMMLVKDIPNCQFYEMHYETIDGSDNIIVYRLKEIPINDRLVTGSNLSLV